MATRYWLGGAVAVAQISSASIDSVDGTPANNTFHVTIGGFAISQVGDTDVATTAAALVATLNASTHPYFAAVTWTNPSGGTITGTADTAGVPFVASLTETGAGTGAVTDFSDDTALAGPNDFNTAENWSGATLPSSSDTIIFADNNIPVRWGLDQSSLTGMTIYVDQSYTGAIGLDRTRFATDADAATVVNTAAEYREHRLTIDYSTLESGRELTNQGHNGSARVNIDNTRSGASTTVVHKTGPSIGPPATNLKTAHASATIEVREAGGAVGIGTDVPGDTMTVGTIDISGSNPATKVSVGPGVTCTTFRQTNGTTVLRAAANITTVTVDGGTVVLEGDGWDAVTLNLNAGTVYLDGQVDITTANIAGGVLDCSRSNKARTIGTLVLSGTGRLIGDPQVTITTKTLPTTIGFSLSMARL